MKAARILMWGHTCSTLKWWESWRCAACDNPCSSLMRSTDNGRPSKTSPWDRGPQLTPQQKKATTGGNANRSRPIGPSGKELCLQLNRGTCHYNTRCQYEHVCSTCGSSGHAGCHHQAMSPASAVVMTINKSSNAKDTVQQTGGTKVGPTHCSPFPSTDPFTPSFLGTRQSISANLSSWEEELVNDTDKEFLFDGIHQGFCIIDKHSGSSIKPVHQQNHISAYQHRAQVEKEFLDHIQIGHHIIADRKPTVAAIPKEDGSVRLIHDGSRPIGAVMTDYSQSDTVKFQMLQDACQLAKPFYYCAKLDLQAAYCSVPIHCDDYKAMGLQWHFEGVNKPTFLFEGENKPTFLFDNRLPFGSNKGPSHFHWLSQAIRRCMMRKGFRGIVACIDDFFIVAEIYEECRRWMDILIKLLRKLGFLISWKKMVGPSQCITFLGIEIDTTSSTLSLGKDKLQQLQQQLQHFGACKRASEQQLQSLAGSLNWACQAIQGGRFNFLKIIPWISGNSSSEIKK